MQPPKDDHYIPGTYPLPQDYQGEIVITTTTTSLRLPSGHATPEMLGALMSSAQRPHQAALPAASPTGQAALPSSPGHLLHSLPEPGAENDAIPVDHSTVPPSRPMRTTELGSPVARYPSGPIGLTGGPIGLKSEPASVLVQPPRRRIRIPGWMGVVLVVLLPCTVMSAIAVYVANSPVTVIDGTGADMPELSSPIDAEPADSTTSDGE
jgi:hypothetical protein